MTRKEFDKNASAYDIISDLVEGQYYANGNSYSYSAGYLSSVLDEVIRQLPRSKQEAMRMKLHYVRIDAWSKVVSTY